MTRAKVLAEPTLQVHVPFAHKLAHGFPNDQVRARRVFAQVCTIVQAVAVVRLAHHPVHEHAGRRWIEADGEDWRQARLIAEPIVGRALLSLDDSIQAMYAVVQRHGGGAPFTVHDAKGWAGVSENTARKRLSILVDHGLLDADSNSSGGRSKSRYYWVSSRVSLKSQDLASMLPTTL
jgi:hypothetical protein